MIEYAQSVPNITAASQNLYELIKARGIAVYPDPDIRLAIQRAIAVETTRGWRITKEKVAHKIDVVVALGMAAYGAVHQRPWQLEEHLTITLPRLMTARTDMVQLNGQLGRDDPATENWLSQNR